jgi:hypothetical protein
MVDGRSRVLLTRVGLGSTAKARECRKSMLESRTVRNSILTFVVGSGSKMRRAIYLRNLVNCIVNICFVNVLTDMRILQRTACCRSALSAPVKGGFCVSIVGDDVANLESPQNPWIQLRNLFVR